MMHALEIAQSQGGRILAGGKVLDRPGFFVEPTIVKAKKTMPIVAEETFAPILYVFEVDDLDEAIELHNAVPQGLSSAIFTDEPADGREHFLSAATAPTAASPTSTSAPRAPRSAARSAARRTPAAAARPARTRGSQYMRRQTCTIKRHRPAARPGGEVRPLIRAG